MKRTYACTHPHVHTYTTPRDTPQTHRQQTRPPVPQQSAAGTTGAISSPPLPPAAPPTEQGSGAPLPPAGLEATGGDRNAWTPLVTRVRVPRLPKDAAVEVQPVLLDGAGPGEAPAKTSASHVDDRADDSDDDDDDDDDARGGASARRRVVSFDAERVGARFVENRWCFARAAVARGDVTAAAVAGAVEALGGALRAAGLGWEHAGTFRGYYAVPERSDASGEEKDILGCFDRLETETELAGWIRIGGDSASPCALAPALAVGFGETRDAGLVLEVSAATRARCDGRGRT